MQPFPCGMQGMAGGAGVCLTPPSALDSSEHQPCFCSPPSPTAVTPITHEQRCPKTPGQCSVFPATHTPRDHTPSHIHNPSSPARVGDAVALRAQTLPKSRAGGVPVLGANQPTSLGAQHPTASCPSFLCTHTHTHTPTLTAASAHPPACTQVPLRGAQRLPTAAPSRWKPRHVHCLELLLCQDTSSQLWGWFCPLGANPVSLPPLFQTLRAATRPGEGAQPGSGLSNPAGVWRGLSGFNTLLLRAVRPWIPSSLNHGCPV